MPERTEFTIRRKVFTLLGAKFHIYNAQGELIGFCKQKAFKLREDIRIYSDETMTDERLRIAARNVIDFSAAYDVVESEHNARLGTLRRKGLKSLVRDEWQVLDEHEQLIGLLQEDSTGLALLRRFIAGWLLPQRFMLRTLEGEPLADFRTHFHPLVHRMTVTMLPDAAIPAPLVLAAAVLLMAIEARQQ
jgi:hypothetical protein